jgi:hypothetical protein
MVGPYATQRMPPRESPQTMRPGIVERGDSGEYWEYLDQFQQGHISVRQWIENNTRTGTFLSPCPLSNTYWGAAGTIRLSGLNRLRFQGAQRVLYRYINPNKLEVLGSSAQTILSNGLLRYPKTNEDVCDPMDEPTQKHIDPPRIPSQLNLLHRRFL